jgi:hypothetical protein
VIFVGAYRSFIAAGFAHRDSSQPFAHFLLSHLLVTGYCISFYVPTFYFVFVFFSSTNCIIVPRGNKLGRSSPSVAERPCCVPER